MTGVDAGPDAVSGVASGRPADQTAEGTTEGREPDRWSPRSWGLRWWRELAYIAVFYAVYSAIRNKFGSAAVGAEHAFDNAMRVIDAERALGLYVEPTVQGWFVNSTGDGFSFQFGGAQPFLQFWNIFYGTFHFAVTAGTLAWIYRRFPSDYRRWRNTLAFTTGLALVGFSLYPLMPPRLLADCGEFGMCMTQYRFVDSLADVGGLWSFDSGTMQSVSNQYAAMPSLHFAWSLWCFAALFPRLRAWWARGLILAYPWLTLFAIVVTANHFWLDAVGGAVILGLGYLLGSTAATWTERRLADQGRIPTPSPPPI